MTIVLWNTIQHMFPREVEARKVTKTNALTAQPSERSNWSFFGRCIFHFLLGCLARGALKTVIKVSMKHLISK